MLVMFVFMHAEFLLNSLFRRCFCYFCNNTLISGTGILQGGKTGRQTRQSLACQGYHLCMHMHVWTCFLWTLER